MTLRISDRGIATAYVTAGVGAGERELLLSSDAVNSLRHDTRLALVSEPESIYLIGQSDLALRMEVADFRAIFDLDYPSADSNARVVNWVFSLPYQNGAIAIDETSVTRSIRFISHVRLRRAIYVYRGIEEAIVHKLHDLLATHAAFITIQAGLGWSDLVVDGYVAAEKFRPMMGLLAALNNLRIGRPEESIEAIQSIMTILGYRDHPPESLDVDRLTFLRVLPGRLHDVTDELKRHGETFSIVDGKADIVLRSHWPDQQDWLHDNHALRDAGVQTLETHLMTTNVEHESASGLFIDVQSESVHRDKCRCEQAHGTSIAKIEMALRDTERSVLPVELRHAIRNVLFLLGAATRDSGACCDLRDAITTCYSGLILILQALQEKAREIPQATIAVKHNEIVVLWQRLDEWLRLTETLLRQRTLRFDFVEEARGAFLYSGGMQKFLFLADALLNDFARRIRGDRSPSLAVVCDAVPSVTSVPAGFVRVPTRKIFVLPLIVADLWHEVGVRLFLQEFAQDVTRYAPVEQRSEFLENVQDYYADLIVYLYGFNGNFKKFTTSLLHRWTEAYRDLPYVAHVHTVGQLLARLYLVYELHVIRSARAVNDVERLKNFYDMAHTVDALIAELRELTRAEFADRGLAPTPPTDEDWMLLRRNVMRTDFSTVKRGLYLPLIRETVTPVECDLAPFERGEIVTFVDTDDLNAYFATLAFRFQSEGRRPVAPFTMMMALAESAENEYHRRRC
jgi:hypothetical protein